MSKYASKTPNADGIYTYTAEETSVWRELFVHQRAFLQNKACTAYLDGLDALGINAASVPQVKDIDASLRAMTGAGVVGVAAIIPQAEFSALLVQRKFPVATFIRTRKDMHYIEEPDIFHEVFGHAPMLTNPAFCRFLEGIGKLAQSLPKDMIRQLYRLFWFSVEFGMIHTDAGRRAFGAGICSSPSEAAHAFSGDAEILPFDPLTVLRTPYRIDILQPIYFELDGFDHLASIVEEDVEALINHARRLGDFAPRYEIAA